MEEKTVQTQQTLWFVLRVQSNREEDVRDNLARVIELEGRQDKVCNVMVPTQTVTEIRGGKRQEVERKLYPGYVFVEVALDEGKKIPDDVWYLIRETSGVGDFIGAEHPSSLSSDEVSRLLGRAEEKKEEAPVLKIDFKEGDIVRVTEGVFINKTGPVQEINPSNGEVKVLIEVFARRGPQEMTLHYWQLEPA